tara:strand:+ start:414 stop:1292 length:879 start_codon:yes stop_codon:yes gene_type:complete
MNGKNFPTGYELKLKKDLSRPLNLNRLKKNLSESFGYMSKFDIGTDFFPLFTNETLKDSYFLEFQDEIIGSILVKNKDLKINDKVFSCACLGGIFIAKNHRGKGLFHHFFKKTLEKISKRKNPDFFILWSEKESLYKKFNFHSTGQTYYEQKHSPAKKSNWEISTLKDLPPNDFNQIVHLWNHKTFKNSFLRTDQDWNEIKNIASCSLQFFRGENNKIENYFLLSKGMDLSGIVHEFTDDERTIKAISSLPRISHKPISDNPTVIPSCLAKANGQHDVSEISEVFCFGLDCI